MDLRDAILKTFDEQLETGKINETITNSVDRFITDAVSSALASYGDFGKVFKEKMQKDLIGRIGDISLMQYNKMIIEVVESRVDAIYLKQAKGHLVKELDKLFQKPSEEYKLSEFVKNLTAHYNDEAEENNWREMSLHVETSSYSNDSKFHHIYIDPSEDKESYQCQYNLFIVDNRVAHCRVRDSYDKRINLMAKKFLSGDKMGEFEKLIFHLMVYDCKFIVDESACDLAYDRGDY